MSKTKTNKSVTKELGAFLSWRKEEIIVYGTFEQQGKQYVNKIWCKICARHKDIILSKLKGAAKKSAEAFTDGTNVALYYQCCNNVKSAVLYEVYFS